MYVGKNKNCDDSLNFDELNLKNIDKETFFFCGNVVFQILTNSTKKTVRHDLKTVSYRLPFSCEYLTKDYKSQTSLHALKAKIRKLNDAICSFRL